VADRAASSGPEFKDGHASHGSVVWASVRLGTGHSGVLDPDLLQKEADLSREVMDPGLVAGYLGWTGRWTVTIDSLAPGIVVA
jgi:hypothetical protein